MVIPFLIWSRRRRPRIVYNIIYFWMLEIIYALFNRPPKIESTWFTDQPPRASITTNIVHRALMYFSVLFFKFNRILTGMRGEGEKSKRAYRENYHFCQKNPSHCRLHHPESRVNLTWSPQKMTGSSTKAQPATVTQHDEYNSLLLWAAVTLGVLLLQCN